MVHRTLKSAGAAYQDEPGNVFDRVALHGISGIGYHGVDERERRDGQPFIVDAVLFTDVRLAAQTDNLSQTVNYAEVAELIRSHIAGPPRMLIETLAEDIAQAILAQFGTAKASDVGTATGGSPSTAFTAGLHAVEVTVHKPKAPILLPFSDVTVSVYRRYDHQGLEKESGKENATPADS